MSKIVYNVETLKLMKVFDSVTRSRLKDCFIDGNDLLTFVVQKNELGKAIGKKAVNVKKMESLFRRKIRIVEFNTDLSRFIRNLIYPIKEIDVTKEGDVVQIKPVDFQARAKLIGRGGSNLRNTENIVKKYFEIKQIKVI